MQAVEEDNSEAFGGVSWSASDIVVTQESQGKSVGPADGTEASQELPTIQAFYTASIEVSYISSKAN